MADNAHRSARRSCRWCGRRDSNPHGLSAQRIFLPATAFAAPAGTSCRRVCGLDYPFTVSGRCRRVRCCPSSLYTFPAPSFGLGLGSGLPFEGFPEFGQFCIRRFPGGALNRLSPLRLPVPPRPRDLHLYDLVWAVEISAVYEPRHLWALINDAAEQGGWIGFGGTRSFTLSHKSGIQFVVGQMLRPALLGKRSPRGI